MYNQKCSEFEVHAIAYSILRKQLYPQYAVRGEYRFQSTLLADRGARPDIAIFKLQDQKEPKLILTVEIKKSKGIATKQGLRYEKALGVPCIYIRGLKEAYNVLRIVKPYLEE